MCGSPAPAPPEPAGRDPRQGPRPPVCSRCVRGPCPPTLPPADTQVRFPWLEGESGNDLLEFLDAVAAALFVRRALQGVPEAERRNTMAPGPALAGLLARAGRSSDGGELSAAIAASTAGI